ncbi:efflux RND transporter periplasmic adaptor subunit [Steroidobacter sp.]|uniref:efflux RND transporter periplasmic adaptor subunit n=1 Tax=Steroidobacter sp. TaxID=1978227 RepID=UPI0025FC11CE|nr:HlyD family efflux transporter periplasmic adaptor subunit [Steroidobacter sp.]
MDHPVVLPWWRRRWINVALTVPALIGVLVALMSWLGPAARSVRAEQERLSIATVSDDVYRDFIPFRATVVPLETIYLDALEGGRVEHVHVQPGDAVTIGQQLIELSNTELELTVLDREARLIESIVQLQAYQTQLEQNHLNNQKALAEIDYNIARLTRSSQRRGNLAERGVESRENFDAVQDELRYAQTLRPLQERSNEQQNALRVQQLPQIAAQLDKLHQDVEITRSKLDALNVRAPAAGRMTAIDLKVGENRNRGARLGEITPATGFKLTAEVDEYYLNRLRNDQIATVETGTTHRQLRVTRVYPRVENGVFRVDLAFIDAMPSDLLPGQTQQGKIALGGDSRTLVLPTGPFLQHTGGNWAFVVSEDGRTAERRAIKIGRRNIEQVEILSGLRAGERVIVSDYTRFERIDRIELDR